MLADYQHQIVATLQKHGGTIHKFMDDGIMITFGAALPPASKDRRPGCAVDGVDAPVDLVVLTGKRSGHLYGSAASRRPSPRKLKARITTITGTTGSISHG